MRSNRFWILIISGVFLLAAVACIFVYRAQGSGTIANIYQDGVCLYSIDLDAVEKGYTLTITGSVGSNVIAVEHGRIRVCEADCPDQICVHQGWISNGVVPVVCLPNHLVIRIEESAPSGELDGMSR